MKTAIYILTENEIPIYVGKSIVPEQRAKAHKGRFPDAILEIIDEVETSEYGFWEKYYISLYKSWGFNLMNKRSGGGKKTRHTQETIEKIRKSNIGLKRSEETKRNISLAGIGKSNAKGKRSEEARRNIALGSIGNTNKMGKKCPNMPSSWNKGVNHSEEHKKKISEGLNRFHTKNKTK